VTTEPDVKQQLLTFVVVGAGFSGVETVAEVRELIRHALKYYPNICPDDVRVYLIEYADRILPTFPADLAEYATRRLRGPPFPAAQSHPEVPLSLSSELLRGVGLLETVMRRRS
jgi:hypothetical protein